MAFKTGYLTCKEKCECGCHFQTQNSSEIQKSEHCILKRIFNGVKRFGSDNNY